MNGYELSRDWFNFRFENPSTVRAVHTELYLYLVDQWNRLGQKKEIGLPTRFTMESLGIGSYNTYKKTLDDLVYWKFVKIVKDSANQHQSKVVAISKNDKASDKALDKATAKARDKATDKPSDTIDEQGNKEQRTIEQDASLVFENFRKLYPGTKRGHQTELDVLKKHKDWKVVLGTLEGIITAEIQWRQNTKSQSPSTFIPEWPHLSTYLKQRRWETVREQTQAYIPPEQRQVTPDLPNHKRGVEYRRSGIENRTFKGNYNEYLDAKGCTPDETFTIVREYVIG